MNETEHSLSADPQTPEEWQDAVNAAHFLLLIDSCIQFGLMETDMRIRFSRCREIIFLGAQLGYHPQELNTAAQPGTRIRRCPRCKHLKPIGRNWSYCKPCTRAYYREYNARANRIADHK